MELDEDEAAFVKTLDLLSYKPIIYVANVSDSDIASGDNEYVKKVRQIAESEKLKLQSYVLSLSQKLLNLTTKKELYSSTNWVSKNQDWINLLKHLILFSTLYPSLPQANRR